MRHERCQHPCAVLVKPVIVAKGGDQSRKRSVLDTSHSRADTGIITRREIPRDTQRRKDSQDVAGHRPYEDSAVRADNAGEHRIG